MNCDQFLLQRPQVHFKNVFKYYPIRDYNIEAFIKGYAYFSHRSELNDPFDSLHVFVQFTEKDLSFFRECYPSINWDQVVQDPKLYEIVRAELASKIYAKVGVFSTTTNILSHLFWSLYTENRGFAIEFNQEIMKSFKAPIKIEYLAELEFSDLDYSDYFPLNVIANYSFKTKEWRREKEHRFVAISKGGFFEDKPNLLKRKMRYSKESIESVTFAFHFFDNLSINENAYTINLFKDRLKRKLLKYTIQKGFKTFLIRINRETRSLKRREIKFERIGCQKYKIQFV